MNRSLFALGILCAAATVSACSNEKKASAAQTAEKKDGVAPRVSVVATPTQPYREVVVAAPGRITGTVDFDGVFPADSVIQLTADQAACGQSVVDHRIDRSGTHVADVAVWLSDIRQGKSRQVDRRYELANEACVFTPRVQTVITGGTVNVISNDVTMHRNRFIDVATGDFLAVAPFNDEGEVIPFDRILTKPAEIEVVCELHPWAKAYLLVFDHPYYAVTDNNGNFTLDGVPPGTYHLRAWHPVLGLVDQTVTVAAGGQATVALKLPGENAPVPAAASAASQSSTLKSGPAVPSPAAH